MSYNLVCLEFYQLLTAMKNVSVLSVKSQNNLNSMSDNNLKNL